jgi:hypothetical protein
VLISTRVPMHTNAHTYILLVDRSHVPLSCVSLLLQVDDDAPMEEIKKAYRSLAKECHPDYLGDEGHNICILLNEAYEVRQCSGAFRVVDSRAAGSRQLGSRFQAAGRKGPGSRAEGSRQQGSPIQLAVLTGGFQHQRGPATREGCTCCPLNVWVGCWWMERLRSCCKLTLLHHLLCLLLGPGVDG